MEGGKDCPFEVVKEGTGERVACHPTREKALAQMKALYANEPMMNRADTEKPYGDVKYADPGYKEDGVKRYPIDTAEHARAALSYFSMAKNHAGYTAEQVNAIMGRIKAACRRFGITIGEEQRDQPTPLDMPSTRIPIECREVTVDNVDFPERIITIRAVPYERPAHVYLPEFRDFYTETFEVGSMDHLIGRPNRVRVNRSHDKNQTVGKVVKFWEPQKDGLIADVRIAKTDRGYDTLGLAADDCLSASIGFWGKQPGWQTVDKRAKTRRIHNAYLDHISFVESPAYDNADVLSVRESIAKRLNDSELIDLLANILVQARPPEQRATPNLDRYLGDDVLRWADERLNKQ